MNPFDVNQFNVNPFKWIYVQNSFDIHSIYEDLCANMRILWHR